MRGWKCEKIGRVATSTGYAAAESRLCNEVGVSGNTTGGGDCMTCRSESCGFQRTEKGPIPIPRLSKKTSRATVDLCLNSSQRTSI